MKQLLSILILALTSLTVTAQKETDFALHFMKMYSHGTTLTCKTVSPAMMVTMLQSETINKDKDTDDILRQLRSLRIISNSDAGETETLYEKAENLIKANQGRYQHYDTFDGKTLYVRQRGKTIVEIVLITKQKGLLYISDLTGSMTEILIKKITHS